MSEGLGRNARKILISAVHYVLSKAGFVPIGRVKMPKNWSSTSWSVRYALPKFNTKDEVILLKFQCSGHLVVAYGFVSCIGESYVHSVSLDERTFSPNLDSIRDKNEAKNMSEFWKKVEETFALPLMIDLKKSGMFHPPRILLLPNNVKLAILEALSGVDIAKLQCVCVELKNLASKNDLWEMKFKKEFPFVDDSVPSNEIWKKKFATHYMYKRLFGEGL